MASITEQIATARQHGYTDAQIADHLAADPTIGPKITLARQHGYADASILDHLAPSPSAAVAAAVDAGGKVVTVAPAAMAAQHRQSGTAPWDDFANSVGQSWDRLMQDWKAGYGPQADRPVQHGPAPLGPDATPTDHQLAALAGNSGANAGGERAAAIDRVTGSDLVDLPMSVIRGGIRAATGLSDQDAGNAFVVGTTAIPVAGGLARDAALARAAPVVRAPTPLQANVAKFEAAGVTPSLAATGGPMAANAAKFAAEDPLMGGVPRRRLQASTTETGQAASRIASGYGTAGSPDAAGQTIQRGVTRFAQDKDAPDSFAARANQHYDRAFSGIPNGTVQLDATQATIDGILGRVQAPTVADLTRSPIVQKLATAIHEDTGNISFSDLRALRTWVREAKGNPELRGNIGAADLNRIEGALTQDIYDNTTRLTNNPSWTRRLQQADRFYRTGMDRIDGSLASSFDAPSPEAAYDRLVASAQAGGRADVGKLLGVKRSLRPEEWGDVVATTIKRLGQPAPGAAAVADGADAFSINNFVTGYNRLSPAGRAILFGSKGGGGAGATGLRAQLDNLAEVADMQKNVERMANSSRTSIAVRGGATGIGLVNPATLGPTIAALTGTRLLGEAMTSPAFVRWLARSAKAPVAMAPARITALTALAKTDRKVAAVLPSIAVALQPIPQPAPQPAGSAQTPQASLQPAQ